MMLKLICMFAAGLLSISLSGLAVSAQKGQAQTAAPDVGGAAATKREQEYLGALKRCEPMSGPDKSQCIDAARKRYGQL